MNDEKPEEADVGVVSSSEGPHLWDVPDMDYMMVTVADTDFVRTRQVNGLSFDIIQSKSGDRPVPCLTLYRTETLNGVLMPLSPQTMRELGSALLAEADRMEEVPEP